MSQKFAKFVSDESGATAIEYGLIAAILSVGIITILKTVRTDLNSTFSKVSTQLQSANTLN